MYTPDVLEPLPAPCSPISSSSQPSFSAGRVIALLVVCFSVCPLRSLCLSDDKRWIGVEEGGRPAAAPQGRHAPPDRWQPNNSSTALRKSACETNASNSRNHNFPNLKSVFWALFSDMGQFIFCPFQKVSRRRRSVFHFGFLIARCHFFLQDFHCGMNLNWVSSCLAGVRMEINVDCWCSRSLLFGIIMKRCWLKKPPLHFVNKPPQNLLNRFRSVRTKVFPRLGILVVKPCSSDSRRCLRGVLSQVTWKKRLKYNSGST